MFLLYHHTSRQQNYVAHPGDDTDRAWSLLTSEFEPPHFAYIGEFLVPIGQRAGGLCFCYQKDLSIPIESIPQPSSPRRLLFRFSFLSTTSLCWAFLLYFLISKLFVLYQRILDCLSYCILLYLLTPKRIAVLISNPSLYIRNLI